MQVTQGAILAAEARLEELIGEPSWLVEDGYLSKEPGRAVWSPERAWLTTTPWRRKSPQKRIHFATGGAGDEVLSHAELLPSSPSMLKVQAQHLKPRSSMNRKDTRPRSSGASRALARSMSLPTTSLQPPGMGPCTSLLLGRTVPHPEAGSSGSSPPRPANQQQAPHGASAASSSPDGRGSPDGPVSPLARTGGGGGGGGPACSDTAAQQVGRPSSASAAAVPGSYTMAAAATRATAVMHYAFMDMDPMGTGADRSRSREEALLKAPPSRQLLSALSSTEQQRLYEAACQAENGRQERLSQRAASRRMKELRERALKTGRIQTALPQTAPPETASPETASPQTAPPEPASAVAEASILLAREAELEVLAARKLKETYNRQHLARPPKEETPLLQRLRRCSVTVGEEDRGIERGGAVGEGLESWVRRSLPASAVGTSSASAGRPGHASSSTAFQKCSRVWGSPLATRLNVVEQAYIPPQSISSRPWQEWKKPTRRAAPQS